MKLPELLMTATTFFLERYSEVNVTAGAVKEQFRNVQGLCRLQLGYDFFNDHLFKITHFVFRYY
jgi:hypothetical protein